MKLLYRYFCKKLIQNSPPQSNYISYINILVELAHYKDTIKHLQYDVLKYRTNGNLPIYILEIKFEDVFVYIGDEWKCNGPIKDYCIQFMKDYCNNNCNKYIDINKRFLEL